jgi:TetR/AcrR family transcriptional repressor of nem operon
MRGAHRPGPGAGEEAVSERARTAEQTREKILAVAADEIYRVGFQAASTAAMLRRLNISKGALYHHFSGKQALGYAVLDEYLAERHAACWDGVLDAASPVDAIIAQLEALGSCQGDDQLRHGCPVNNLAQEMSPLDEGFRARVSRIYRHWQRTLERALEQSVAIGEVRVDVDPAAVAALVLATSQGATSLAKNSRDSTLLRKALAGLLDYLRSLKTASE